MNQEQRKQVDAALRHLSHGVVGFVEIAIIVAALQLQEDQISAMSDVIVGMETGEIPTLAHQQDSDELKHRRSQCVGYIEENMQLRHELERKHDAISSISAGLEEIKRLNETLCTMRANTDELRKQKKANLQFMIANLLQQIGFYDYRSIYPAADRIAKAIDNL